ncbi:hypothetical protein BDP27DRAFT_1251200 [Rhodocollybia butyracea]|uniref:Secreted protein n=1 Tax=Rhodocollybia butyracea TaxID=206335 RepID=A0A9P5TWC7_9AGAR|nr:hypothetical protein BDP27DRAFT_1251200 [Rhodocollybia butyracea]
MHIPVAPTILVVLCVITNSAAQNFIAWSGIACNGDEGLNIPCDGSCHEFGGRNSYVIVSAGTFCPTFFANGGCTGGALPFNSSTLGECIPVNTGINLQSFSCFPC